MPGSERLADTHAKDNLAFERMHVEQAQELATGRGVKVAVIDSGMVGIEGLDIAGGLAIEGVNPTTRLSGHGTIVARADRRPARRRARTPRSSTSRSTTPTTPTPRRASGR